MKDKSFFKLLMIVFALGMIFSMIGLFRASAFSDVPGNIARAEKGFWLFVGIGNFCFIGFIISLFLIGNKEEPKAK